MLIQNIITYQTTWQHIPEVLFFFSFHRYVREGSDRTRGNDIVKLLSSELDATEVKIRKLLHRHPYWCHVPLVTVRETLDFLLNRGFTRCHILFNIHALLYSRSVAASLHDKMLLTLGLSHHCRAQDHFQIFIYIATV
jgi:hypothetical protein